MDLDLRTPASPENNLGALLARMGNLYTRLETAFNAFQTHAKDFYGPTLIETLQGQVINYGKCFFDTNEMALHSDDPDKIGAAYQEVVALGETILGELIRHTQLAQDFRRAKDVETSLLQLEQQQHARITPSESEDIQHYCSLLETLFDEARSQMPSVNEFSQLADAGQRKLDLIKARLAQHLEPIASKSAWSSVRDRSIPLDTVDTGAFEPVAASLPIPETSFIVSADDETEPPPTSVFPHPKSEVELFLEEHRLQAEHTRALALLKESEAMEEILRTGGPVRRWMRHLTGNHDKDAHARLEARKKAVEARKEILRTETALTRVRATLSEVRKETAAQRQPEVALEPERRRLTGDIARLEGDLLRTKARFDRAYDSDDRAYWAQLFSDQQTRYRTALDELDRVETTLYGRPMQRITSALKAINLNQVTVVMPTAYVPGVGPISVSSPRPIPKTSVPVNNVIRPHVPEWEEWHERRTKLAEQLQESWALRQAMSDVPLSRWPRQAVPKAKIGADRPTESIPRTQFVQPGMIPSHSDARDRLTSILPDEIMALRKQAPLASEVMEQGIANAREHLGVAPFDYNEFERLERRRDVLPAAMAKLEDEIETLSAEPSGLFARAKRFFSGGKQASRLIELRKQLDVLTREETEVHSQLDALRKQVA